MQQHSVQSTSPADKATAPETATSKSIKRSKISHDPSPAAAAVPVDVSDDTEANTVEEDDDPVRDQVMLILLILLQHKVLYEACKA